MKKKRLTAKAMATIAAVTFVSAGAAAAAGVVPTPFSAPRPSITDSTEATDDDATEDTAADTTAVTTAAPAETGTEATEAADPTEEIEDTQLDPSTWKAKTLTAKARTSTGRRNLACAPHLRPAPSTTTRRPPKLLQHRLRNQRPTAWFERTL